MLLDSHDSTHYHCTCRGGSSERDTALTPVEISEHMLYQHENERNLAQINLLGPENRHARFTRTSPNSNSQVDEINPVPYQFRLSVPSQSLSLHLKTILKSMENVPSRKRGSGDRVSPFEIENERPPRVTVFSTRKALSTSFAL